MSYKWTKEFPTEKGSYWFYGCMADNNKDPGLYYVECWEISNGIMLMANGAIWHESEAGPGKFAKIDVDEIVNSATWDNYRDHLKKADMNEI